MKAAVSEMKKDTTRIDAINIGLMILAVVPALFFPFELFLLVYAILGPLHYLTEINWLHKKGYFTNQKNDYLVIVAFVAIIGFLIFSKSYYRSAVPLLTFIIFAATFAMVAFKKVKAKLLFAILFSAFGFLLFEFWLQPFKIVFSTLLPTIIHVFIFTGAFILLGALKSGSKMGVISVIIFTACTLFTVFAGKLFNNTPVSKYIYNAYGSFRNMNRVLIRLFGFLHTSDIKSDFALPAYAKTSDISLYFTDAGIKVMRFIAFAYTYHYLNWFSKTSVIQWHNTKKRNLIIIFAIWIASVVLYVYNYKMGLKWLFLLSFGHVLLEFPLNHRSFIDIHKQITARFLTKKA